MGTQLIARGVEIGRCNDALNVESPDVIREIHQAYFEAGSDAVITNTFGANRYTLTRHGRADEVVEINKAGAKLARQAAGDERYVLGDVGPSGDFLKPVGMLEPDALKEAFEAQAQGLLDGGVDGFIVETMTALDELEVAIEAVRSVSGELPVFSSMSFDKGGAGFRTMMGVDVPSAVAKMVALGADAVGFNCGTTTLEEYVELAELYVAAVESCGRDVILFAEPNAGKPELTDGQAVYKVTPEEYADAVEKIHALGIHVVGGCCGTGPSYIKAAAERLR
jgi:methionine synthase I (cobalamin-dependent)